MSGQPIVLAMHVIIVAPFCMQVLLAAVAQINGAEAAVSAYCDVTEMSHHRCLGGV